MNKSRKNRMRLFGSENPKIRLANRDDVALYLYAYRVANGHDPDPEYREMIEHELAEYDSLRVLEDRNAAFNSERSPVGLVKAMDNGWTHEPHVDWFPWATTRNKLRCAVAYLYKQRCSRDVGVAVIHSEKQDLRWYKHLKQYVPLYFSGKIPAGRPDGDEYLFYLRGKRPLEII